MLFCFKFFGFIEVKVFEIFKNVYIIFIFLGNILIVVYMFVIL